MNTARNSTDAWLQPPEEQQGLRRYLAAIRERLWLVVLAVIVATGAALFYVSSAEKVYEAEVQVIVSPVDDLEGTLASLGLITESGDPLRAVETAATLLVTNEAAERAAEELGLDREPASILNDIIATPVAESNIVSVTASSSTAEGAAELANGFVEASLASRSRRVRDAIDDELPALKDRLSQVPEGVASETLAAQIAQLEALRVSGDPTLRVIEPALAPGAPVSPRPIPSIIAGVLAGLVLGVGAVFTLRMLDPRLRREEQVRSDYTLPILARVPQQRMAKHRPLVWNQLPPGAIEAYRTLRAVLTGPSSRSSEAKSILITSAGPGEGKTTSAIALAASLALTHKRVILIEADLRRPAIGKALDVSVDSGVTSVLVGDSTLAESLVTAPIGADYLALLLAEEAGGAGAELLALPTAQELIAEAKKIADVVVIDSPPLATVVDALPLARAVDEIVLVLKLGSSRMDRVRELAEMLADSGLKPSGFLLIGVSGQSQGYYGDPKQRKITAWSATRPAARAD